VTLDTTFERHELSLERPFTIARGTTETTETIVVTISDGTHEGIGGASPSSHYGETVETVAAVLPDLLAIVEDVGDPEQLQRIERRMRALIRGNPAARSAVSIALHDLVAKRHDRPLVRYWGLDPTNIVETSYTIGIDDPDAMGEHAADAVDRGYSVLKVKLGTDDDRARIAAVRDAAPEARLRVDANEAWGPHEALELIDVLYEHDVTFVEQPVAANRPNALRQVHDRSPLPIALDESCSTLSDVPAVADRCSIVTLKLMKCGGLRETIRTIHAARAHGLEVMLGCMTESNASIAAACHLAPLLDYADLDGSLLLADDPYDGVPMPDGFVDPSAFDRPGTGARLQ